MSVENSWKKNIFVTYDIQGEIRDEIDIRFS